MLERRCCVCGYDVYKDMEGIREVSWSLRIIWNAVSCLSCSIYHTGILCCFHSLAVLSQSPCWQSPCWQELLLEKEAVSSKDFLGSRRPSLMEKYLRIEQDSANGHTIDHNLYAPKLVLTARALVFHIIIISWVFFICCRNYSTSFNYSLYKMFREINFCSLERLRKYSADENFQIHGSLEQHSFWPIHA